MDFCLDCQPMNYSIYSGILVYLAVYALSWGVFIRKQIPTRRLYIGLLFAWIAFTLDITLLPIAFSGDAARVTEPNFELWRFITEIGQYQSWTVLKYTVLNIALFVPIGIILKNIFRKASNLKIILYCAVFSVFIESTQGLTSLLGMSYRIFDVDDIILNTLGGGAGIVLASLGMHLRKKKHQSWAELPYIKRHPWIIELTCALVMVILCFFANHLVY